MLKRLLIALFTFAVMTPQAFAQQTIKLNPKESKQLTNSLLWTLNATCKIQSEQGTNVIRVSVTENKGTVNGRNLTKGQATSLRVKGHESISVSAEPGTTVNLVNLGSKAVEAVCYS